MAGTDPQFDVIIIGAGFAGIYGLYKLREAGFRALAVEASDDIGGVWHQNRYPGARCDVDSVEYCYAFSEELNRDWTWSERYATQREINAYQHFVVERLDLRRDMRFNSRVISAFFDRTTGVWNVGLADGDSLAARYVIMATGCLSVPKLPDIPGIDDFGGRILHSVDWPREPVDMSAMRVGIIGTGSTGIQMIPILAEQAKHLTVFQRTPPFLTPARNAPWPAETTAKFKTGFRELRKAARNTRAGVLHDYGTKSAEEVPAEERLADLERRWVKGGPNVLYGFNDLLRNEKTNDIVAEFLRGKIREAVDDPATADILTPRGYPAGAKRICVDTNYLATYNRDNVTLVDLPNDPIEQVEADGVRTRNAFHPLDTLVLATGFDAITGALLAIDIRTSDGRSLREQWADGPNTYLGYGIAGFPNMFVITGPGSPSVISNMVLSIEYDIEWITRCLETLRGRGFATIEVDETAQQSWMEHVNDIVKLTLVDRANSWYRGANIAGKPQTFMAYLGGVDVYQNKAREVADDDYKGFLITAPSNVTAVDGSVLQSHG